MTTTFALVAAPAPHSETANDPRAVQEAALSDFVEKPEYLICKYGGYYRPDASGYTNDPHHAGRYTFQEAFNHSHPNGPDGPRDGMTFIHESEVPASPEADRLAALEAENARLRKHVSLLASSIETLNPFRIDVMSQYKEPEIVRKIQDSFTAAWDRKVEARAALRAKDQTDEPLASPIHSNLPRCG